MGDTASTESAVSRCFAAWTARDTATVRDLLQQPRRHDRTDRGAPHRRGREDHVQHVDHRLGAFMAFVGAA